MYGLILHLEWFVDVQDTARLHVAALTKPDIKNERMFTFSEPFNWKYVQHTLIQISSDILKALQKLCPNQNFTDGFADNNVRDLSKPASQQGAEIFGIFSKARPGYPIKVGGE